MNNYINYAFSNGVRIFLAVVFTVSICILTKIYLISKFTPPKATHVQSAISTYPLQDHPLGTENFQSITTDKIYSSGDITMDDVEANTIALTGSINRVNVRSNVASMSRKVILTHSSIRDLAIGGEADLIDCKIDTLRIIPAYHCSKHIVRLRGFTL